MLLPLFISLAMAQIPIPTQSIDFLPVVWQSFDWKRPILTVGWCVCGTPLVASTAWSTEGIRLGYATETPHYSRPLSRGSKSCASQNLIVPLTLVEGTPSWICKKKIKLFFLRISKLNRTFDSRRRYSVLDMQEKNQALFLAHLKT